jgi:large subunit ribosomal protein L6
MELANDLTLYLGFSHPVIVKIPTGISLKLEKNLLTGNSFDKQAIGDFFSKIYSLKPCDVYKHKGFKVPGKFYRKKEGKKAK